MERAVLDTSAVLTIFCALDIRGEKLEGLEIVVPKCVETELSDFKRHEDYLAERASSAIKEVSVESDPLSEDELEEERSSLGLGAGGITNCDLQAFHLSLRLNLPFFTDDFSAQRHFSTHYPTGDLFFGILLTLDILGIDRLSEANHFVFGKLIPKRFPKITDKNKANIKIAIDEYLSRV